MTEQVRDDFFELLKKKVLEVTRQAEIVRDEEDEDDISLRTAFTLNYGEGGECVFETEFIYDWDDRDEIEIFATFNFQYLKENEDQMEKAVLSENFLLSMGSLGIFYPNRRVFMKYMEFVDPETDAESLADYVFDIFDRMGQLIGIVYEPLKRVGLGISTFEEEVRAGNLVEQRP